MAQQLTALSVLPEKAGSIPNTCMAVQILSNSSSRGSNAFHWPPTASDTHILMKTSHPYTYQKYQLSD